MIEYVKNLRLSSLDDLLKFNISLKNRFIVLVFNCVLIRYLSFLNGCEGYYVVAALSVNEALFMRNVSIYLNIFLQISRSCLPARILPNEWVYFVMIFNEDMNMSRRLLI